MKKSLLAAVLAFASLSFISCGSYSAPSGSGSGSGNTPPSKLKFRAFVSNPVQSFSGGINLPVLDIMDATQDLISLGGGVSLITSINDPQRMYVSPTLTQTLVFSPDDKAIAIVDNATEKVDTTNNPSIKLAGLTESIALAQVGTIGYAAEPGALVNGQNSGAVQVFDYTAQAVTATLPVAAAHYLALAPDGNHMLVFSDNSNSTTLVATSLIGTASEPRSTIPGFDHPVGGIFLDNGNAVVFNCGPECGGTTASVALVNIASGTVTTIPVRGATTGFLSGTSTLYVVGTPPGTFCGSSTQAQFCGTLDIVNLATHAVTQAPNLITDGFHYLMQMGSNGQLFIGSKNCTNLNTNNNPKGEVRGCLSIYNTASSAVTVPPAQGDVTGIQPITGRTVVYVCQNGKLQIYDTGTDALQATQVTIVGQAYDVKLVDLPSN